MLALAYGPKNCLLMWNRNTENYLQINIKTPSYLGFCQFLCSCDLSQKEKKWTKLIKTCDNQSIIMLERISPMIPTGKSSRCKEYFEINLRSFFLYLYKNIHCDPLQKYHTEVVLRRGSQCMFLWRINKNYFQIVIKIIFLSGALSDKQNQRI